MIVECVDCQADIEETAAVECVGCERPMCADCAGETGADGLCADCLEEIARHAHREPRPPWKLIHRERDGDDDEEDEDEFLDGDGDDDEEDDEDGG